MSNVEKVRAYFRALDAGDEAALEQLFAPNCEIWRPGVSAPLRGHDAIKGVVRNAKAHYAKFETSVDRAISEGDSVCVRLTHRATMAGAWNSRIGRHDVAGRQITWRPIVWFDFRDGKIAAEYVCRDELGMALDLGVLKP